MNRKTVIFVLSIIIITIVILIFFYTIPYKTFNISNEDIDCIYVKSGANGNEYTLEKEEFDEIINIINNIHYCNYPKFVNTDGWSYKIIIVYKDGTMVSYCNNGKYSYKNATENKSIRFWCYKSQIADLENYIDKLFS